MRRRKKTTEGPIEVGRLLEGALKQLGMKGDYDRFRIDQKCREAVGEKVSRALVRVELKRKTVHLEFEHAIWIQEMGYRKDELLRALQRELPELGLQGISLGLSRGRRR